jgi:hypothetical protein
MRKRRLQELVEHLQGEVDELTDELTRTEDEAAELVAHLVHRLKMTTADLGGCLAELDTTDSWADPNKHDPTYWQDLESGSEAATMEAEQWLHENGHQHLLRRIYPET